jgi:hypothetical protein
MTTRSKITLRNNFHNTEATVIALDNIISARAMRRAKNKLCGISDCKCGGRRGPQDVYLEPINYAGDFRVVDEDTY